VVGRETFAAANYDLFWKKAPQRSIPLTGSRVEFVVKTQFQTQIFEECSHATALQKAI
jgi:hypothetical protein